MGSPSTVPADKHVGPYRLVRELGRGGMGRVYEAVRDGRPYAVKVFSATHGNLDFLRKRFCVEARILSLKDFYLSPVYARLEQEESKYWWMSPDQLAQIS